jgi:hypothetical protein
VQGRLVNILVLCYVVELDWVFPETDVVVWQVTVKVFVDAAAYAF